MQRDVTYSIRLVKHVGKIPLPTFDVDVGMIFTPNKYDGRI
jgi:hypothetical protein